MREFVKRKGNGKMLQLYLRNTLKVWFVHNQATRAKDKVKQRTTNSINRQDQLLF